MRKEAEQYAEEDKKKHKQVETRNKADSLIFQTEKTLKEHGEKLSDEVKKPINEKVAELKKILENKDAPVEEIEKGFETLSQELQKIGTELYKNVQEDAEKKGGGGGAGGEKDEPVEGEVVEEEKKKEE